MDLTIYNTQTKTKEIFTPLDKNYVRMFVCGPTVYGPAHAGHAKTYTQFDFIASVLKRLYPHVTYAMNETDIDDKLIIKARHDLRDGTRTDAIARRWSKYFWLMMEALGNHAVDNVYKATDHVPEVIHQVARLLEHKKAYVIPQNGIYFDLSTFPQHGSLHHIPDEQQRSRLTSEVNKRNAGDFAIWKFAKADEPVWEAPFGAGRPGWHIEDTAITERYFGEQYDLHGGATDLIFPHHEAEIAQMESLSGKNLVEYWMHTGLLEINGSKMGKSLNNFVTIEHLLEDWDWRTLRYAFLRIHYRSTMHLSSTSLSDAQATKERVEHYYHSQANQEKTTSISDKFWHIILDDFNTPKALGVLFEAMRAVEASQTDIERINELLGGVFDLEIQEAPESVQALVQEREQKRRNRQWLQADAIRDRLIAQGWSVEDTDSGPRLRKS